MKKFYNIRIKSLLLLSFGILLVIQLFLGGVSTYNSRNIAANTRTLYERPHTNLVGMWTVKSEIAQTGNGIRQWMLFDEPLPDELSAHITDVKQEMETIESNKVDKKAETSDEMKAILTSIENWSSKAAQITEELSSGNSIPKEAALEYAQAEQEAIQLIDSIIVTASGNALKFSTSAMDSANKSLWFIALIFMVAVVITILLWRLAVHNITHPVNILLQSAKHIEEGRLGEEIPYRSSSEFGELAECFRQMQTSLRSVVRDLTDNLDKISQGNFQVEATAEYVGEFEDIKTSFYLIADRLSNTLSQINHSADEVAGGAEQVSNGAQDLSQGATEQASSTEELAATIADISTHVEENASSANEAVRQAEETSTQLEIGKEDMEQMLKAMDEINHTSEKIGNIIRTIEDIAFQTNILALNAAVEAARAGEAGKGFAVVADEVSNLAGKSSQASHDTTVLIEDSIKSVQEGTQIANKTASTLKRIIESSEKSATLLQTITKASNEQAESLAQVTEGIEQISGVVQTNSATAEESAASSQELSSQAHILKSLVSGFHLKERGE